MKGRARPRSCSPCCTPAASSAAAATRSPAASTASASRSSTRCRAASRSRSTATATATTWTSTNGGKLKTKLDVTGKAPRGRTGTTVAFWPDPTIFEDTEFRAQTLLERFQMMAFLNKGLEIRFQRPAPRRHLRRAGRLQVRRRHHRLREAPQRLEGAAVHRRSATSSRSSPSRRSRSRSSGTPASTPTASTASPTASPPSRAACTSRASEVAHQRGQQVRPGQGPPQGEGGEPPGRGHPRGPHRHHLGAPPGARSSRARPRPSSATSSMRSLVEKATNEKLADWLEENPTEARKVVNKARQRRPGPPRRPQRPRGHPPQVARSRARACPSKLKDCSSRRPRRVRAVHRRGRLRRWLGRRAPATRAPRRSCPSAARSSTSSGPASTRC